jgi:Dolichyl-phosphate-mannose-protein mannosyltransferase
MHAYRLALRSWYSLAAQAPAAPMIDKQNTIAMEGGWYSFPLLIFAVSRTLLFAFAKAAPLFGPQMGTGAMLPREFSTAYPTWAALGHGEISGYARIARSGYAGSADILFGPILPLLGKGVGAVVGSIELGLMLLSFLACAVGFVGVYRLFEKLRNPDTARWGLAVLAAFPLSYHLSDGSGLGWLLAFSTWGVLLALQGRRILATALLSVGALAHPACAIFALAAAALASQPGRQARAWKSLLPALAPILVVALWFIGGLWRFGHAGMKAALLAQPVVAGSAWKAIMLSFSALLGVGLLALLRTPGVRLLAIVGALHLAAVLYGWNTLPAVALACCWPAFLGLGAILEKRQAWRAPAVAMLCAHQGLILYCFTHFLRSS